MFWVTQGILSNTWRHLWLLQVVVTGLLVGAGTGRLLQNLLQYTARPTAEGRPVADFRVLLRSPGWVFPSVMASSPTHPG